MSQIFGTSVVTSTVKFYLGSVGVGVDCRHFVIEQLDGYGRELRIHLLLELVDHLLDVLQIEGRPPVAAYNYIVI